MKHLITMAVVVAALVQTTAVQARPHQLKRWHNLTLTQKRQVVVRTIWQERGPLRWWLSHRPRFPQSATSSASPLMQCAAVGTRLPGPICIHASRMVAAIHVRRLIDIKLAAIAAAKQAAAFERLAMGDFESAARIADRIFPGSYQWLMDCSGSEGGHGQWVWNGGAPYSSPNHGSGAGGWLQFMEGTFNGSVSGAFETARERGHQLPDAARSWLSPLGQAVTGAYVRWKYGTGAWTGGSC